MVHVANEHMAEVRAGVGHDGTVPEGSEDRRLGY